MSDKIDEIRDRHSRRSEIDQSGCYRLDGFTYMGSLSQSQEDVATLLAEVDRQRAEIERLTRERDKAWAALKPFAALSLWPDDIGDEWTVNDIRSGYDWDETENDTKTDDVFIKRGHIRAARKALESKP